MARDWQAGLAPTAQRIQRGLPKAYEARLLTERYRKLTPAARDALIPSLLISLLSVNYESEFLSEQLCVC